MTDHSADVAHSHLSGIQARTESEDGGWHVRVMMRAQAQTTWGGGAREENTHEQGYEPDLAAHRVKREGDQ